MFRKTYLEKRFSCDRAKIEDVLLRLGYANKDGNRRDFYRRTPDGRLHIKLDSMTKDSCKIIIHHDLTGPAHYTVPLDSTPRKAWEQIKNELLSVCGKNFELKRARKT